MLTIRKEQLSTLDGLALRPYIERVLHSLRAIHVVLYKQIGSNGFRAAITRGIELGRQYDIRREEQVSDLIEMILLFGESFERSQGAAYALEILQHPTLQPVLKTAMIRKRLLRITGGLPLVKGRLSVEKK